NDRAHDVFLDHVVTGGLVAASIWIAILVSIVVVGARRLRADPDEDWALRVGCLGAIVGHVVEGVTGIETIVPFALLWLLAALLTAPPLANPRALAEAARSRTLWVSGLVIVAAIGSLAVAFTTVWVLGSRSYAYGIALARAERFADARAQFEQATRLVPWLP